MLCGLRLRWIALLGVLLLLAPSAPPTNAALQSSVSPRMRAFAEAAHRSGVPLPVLIGLAWEQSMLSDHQGLPSIDHGYGLLDLSARRQHDTLDAAARLLHVSPLRLRRSDALNVLGGALLLAQTEHHLGYRRLPRAVSDWDRAIVEFTGMRTAFAGGLIIRDLDRALQRGINAEGVRLAPLRGIHPAGIWMRNLRLSMSQATETSGPADYPGALWEPANYNNYTDAKRPSDYHIRYIVIHDTEGSCGTTVNWFSNAASQASAHYLVCLDGTVIQTVHERDIAWHAGNWPINLEAIGIEHEGYSDQAYYTRAQYLASAALVRYLCHKYGIDPNRNVIFGHENVPAADHTDPGKYWNWDFYMREIRGDATGYAGGITAIALIDGNAAIYSCPQVSCSVLGSANWGEQFFIAHEQPGWDAIYYGGQLGWIPGNEITAGSGTILQVTSDAPVLSGPEADAQSLGTIPAGQSYISLTQDNGYWYIYYNHRYGFVSNGAVQTTPCPAPAAGTSMAPLCVLNSGASLAATPNTGTPGTTVAVAGSGFATGPVSFSVAGQAIGTAQAGPSGSFAATVILPAGITPGAATIIARDAAGRSVQAPFQVAAPAAKPAVVVSPQEVAGGGEVAVSGTGFPPESTVTITGTFRTSTGPVIVTQLAPTGADGSLLPVNLPVAASVVAGTGTITVSGTGVNVSSSVMLQPGTASPTDQATTTPPPKTPTPRPSPTPTPAPKRTPSAPATGVCLWWNSKHHSCRSWRKPIPPCAWYVTVHGFGGVCRRWGVKE